jgi:hypothetical protein
MKLSTTLPVVQFGLTPYPTPTPNVSPHRVEIAKMTPKTRGVQFMKKGLSSKVESPLDLRQGLNLDQAAGVRLDDCCFGRRKMDRVDRRSP